VHKGSLKHLTLLYAEDEAPIRIRMEKILSSLFGEVVSVENGEDALKAFETHNIDIMLLDIEMPRMNAVSVVEAVRAKDKEIPIIILTAYTDQAYLLPLINLRVHKYLVKPVDLGELKHVLTEVVQAKIPGAEDRIVIGGVCYDRLNRSLDVDGDEIQLTRQEDRFMSLLFKYSERVVTYDEIEKAVWLEKPMTVYALKSLLKNLRRKLPRDIFKNFSKSGYKILG